MDAIENLFIKKTEEATRILANAAAAKEKKEKDQSELPFEVNKVLRKINEETSRRAKLSKRKPLKEL